LEEQAGAQAGRLEWAAQPGDEREQAQAGVGKGASAAQGFGAKRREAHEACRRRRARSRHQSAVPHELEQILATDFEASTPTADQLAAGAKFTCDVALGSALALDGGNGSENELHRMNFSREGVAGQHTLARSAGQATRQDHREPLVAAIPSSEASLHPALCKPDL